MQTHANGSPSDARFSWHLSRVLTEPVEIFANLSTPSHASATRLLFFNFFFLASPPTSGLLFGAGNSFPTIDGYKLQ